MYCPKCKQNFEDGSRRFCPTDGARLVSESMPKREGGVFANLIPRMDAISDIDDAVPESARTRTETEMDLNDKAAPEEDELFFEIDDDRPATAMDETAFL